MAHTFEELATGELDGLYQGALFLSAGDEDQAESLLTDMLARSFQAFGTADSVDDITRWLEGKLVLTFLDRGLERLEAPKAASRMPERLDPSVFDALDARGLHAAAAAVPALARVALWLVLLRRWAYDEASEVLGLGRDGLQDLLRHRHTLMAAILGGTRGGVGRGRRTRES